MFAVAHARDCRKWRTATAHASVCTGTTGTRLCGHSDNGAVTPFWPEKTEQEQCLFRPSGMADLHVHEVEHGLDAGLGALGGERLVHVRQLHQVRRRVPQGLFAPDPSISQSVNQSITHSLTHSLNQSKGQDERGKEGGREGGE
eukprot:2674901-Rhodomonas_salina.1